MGNRVFADMKESFLLELAYGSTEVLRGEYASVYELSDGRWVAGCPQRGVIGICARERRADYDDDPVRFLESCK